MSGLTQEVCYIMRRNGAYLICWTGELTDSITPDEMYDCAASITTARRIAKVGARELGYHKLRWTERTDVFAATLEGAPE